MLGLSSASSLQFRCASSDAAAPACLLVVGRAYSFIWTSRTKSSAQSRGICCIAFLSAHCCCRYFSRTPSCSCIPPHCRRIPLLLPHLPGEMPATDLAAAVAGPLPVILALLRRSSCNNSRSFWTYWFDVDLRFELSKSTSDFRSQAVAMTVFLSQDGWLA
jgi:hypothetical protein